MTNSTGNFTENVYFYMTKEERLDIIKIFTFIKNCKNNIYLFHNEIITGINNIIYFIQEYYILLRNIEINEKSILFIILSIILVIQLTISCITCYCYFYNNDIRRKLIDNIYVVLHNVEDEDNLQDYVEDKNSIQNDIIENKIIKFQDSDDENDIIEIQDINNDNDNYNENDNNNNNDNDKECTYSNNNYSNNIVSIYQLMKDGSITIIHEIRQENVGFCKVSHIEIHNKIYYYENLIDVLKMILFIHKNEDSYNKMQYIRWKKAIKNNNGYKYNGLLSISLQSSNSENIIKEIINLTEFYSIQLKLFLHKKKNDENYVNLIILN